MSTNILPIGSIEMSMVNTIAEVLKGRVGKKNAVTNRELQESFPELSERSIQAIINHIRNFDVVPCLVASSQGYYVAETESELQDYEKSLNNRIGELVKVRDQVARQRALRFKRSYQEKLFR